MKRFSSLTHIWLAYLYGVLLPTAVLVAWGYSAVTREGELLRGQRSAGLEHEARAAARWIDATLADVERAENCRSCLEYFALMSDPNEQMAQEMSLQLSPIHVPPRNEIVFGYFQVSPRGEISTPHRADVTPETGGLSGLDAVQLSLSQGVPTGICEAARRLFPRMRELVTPELLARHPGPSVHGGNAWRVPQGAWEATQNFVDVYNTRCRESGQSPPDASTAPSSWSRTVNLRASPFVTVTSDDAEFGLGNEMQDRSGDPDTWGGACVCRVVQAPDGYWIQGYGLNLPALMRKLRSDHRPGAVSGSSARLVRWQVPDRQRDLPEYQRRRWEGAARVSVPVGMRLPGLAIEVADTCPEQTSLQISEIRARYLRMAGGVVVVILLSGGLIVRTAVVQRDLALRKGDFVSSVTHELKTPLSVIRMYAEMLRDGWTDDPAKRTRYLDHITRESDRLGRLIRNVLDLSRVERDPASLAVRLGSVEPVVREVIETMAPELARDGFRVALDAEPGLPEVRFDADALRQILVNLLDNARKYGRPEGEGVGPHPVEVRLARDGAGVRLEVADRGAGIPDAERADLFTRFSRGARAREAAAAGAGLGLAVARALARAMGGALSLAPANGPGARFALRLAA